LAKEFFEISIYLKNLLIRRPVPSKAEGRRKETLSPKKDFLKILGSNLFLKDLTLLVSYNKPFDLIAKSQGSSDWLCICNDIRTYFKGLPLK
jgi:hypothetical protein